MSAVIPCQNQRDNADSSAKSATVSVDRQATIWTITHRLDRNNSKTRTVKIWLSLKHQENKLRKRKPGIEVWKSSFNKNRRIEYAVEAKNQSVTLI